MRNKKLNTPLIVNTRGFTLIEILVSVAIVGLMMSAVFAIYISNVRSVNVEAERVEIQQGQRISFDFLARELRLAAYDKTDSDSPRILDARSNFIYFTADKNDDGDVNDANPDEHVAFCIYDSDTEGLSLGYVSGADAAVGNVGGSGPNDGDVPVGHTGHAHRVFSPIEAIEFYYTLADGTQTTDPGEGRLDDIKSVVITILARADSPDPDYTDIQTYARPSGAVAWGPFNDRLRRRVFSMTVHFRNMGLG